MASNLEKIIKDSIQFIESKDYKSYDLFDALTNPLIDILLKPFPFLRRVAIQANANIPLNIRFMGMKKMVHTKLISDMLSIYSMMYSSTGDEEYAKKAHTMYQLLLRKKLKTEFGSAWGLNFPYTSRFVNANVNTPNLYNTVNSALSILDYYVVFPSNEIKDEIKSVVNFIFKGLGIVKYNENVSWLLYYPSQKSPTFNVNALAIYLFAKINYLFKEEYIDKDTIREIFNLLKDFQNKDGSWNYALDDKGKWVDGFHSGFILEAIAYLNYTNPDDFDIKQTFETGFIYFKEHLINEDFIPKYYNNNLYPIDAQNCAQAIQTIANISEYSQTDNKKLLINIIENVISILYDQKGYFYHKKTSAILYKQPYLRWSQSPMILALIYSKKYLGK